MVRYVNLGDLSNYRTELMGFSALLILICHSTAYIDMPSIVVYAFSVANIGVDLFLFFSGMGMWYSLQRWCDVSHKGNNRNVCWGGVMRWYLNRYRQLLVPYLLTLVPIVICQAAMGNAPAHGIVDYVLYITSFRFYVSHDAPWFIAAIIPLYLLAPLFFSLIKKYAWQASDLIIVVMWSILLIKPTSDTEVFNNILQNIQFVSVRATSFVLGISWGGGYVQQRRHVRVSLLALLVFLGGLLVLLSKQLVYGYLFFSLPALFIMIYILDNCDKSLKTHV